MHGIDMMHSRCSTLHNDLVETVLSVVDIAQPNIQPWKQQ
jgi:hypothetical protein